MTSRTEIPLSKTKVSLFTLAGMSFVAFGILFIVNPENFTSGRLNNPDAIRIIGIVSALFFGGCLPPIVRKLFDRKPGLVIDNDGVFDNSSYASPGLIEWRDISGIQRLKQGSIKFLILETQTSHKFINRTKNRLSKQIMRANLRWYNSPIIISSSTLKINFDRLEQLLSTEFEKRKAHHK